MDIDSIWWRYTNQTHIGAMDAFQLLHDAYMLSQNLEHDNQDWYCKRNCWKLYG